MNAGVLESAYRSECQNLVSANAVKRLWAKDTSLWPEWGAAATIYESYLEWLDLPQRLGSYIEQTLKRSGSPEEEGFQDVIFVGMGSANLAAETIARLPIAKRGNHLLVLDTTNPTSIRAVEKALDLRRTIFIFASKSGKHIETHALLLYFIDRLKALGVKSPGAQFFAATEENSYLARLAREYGFRENFLDPPGIRGRYSTLIHFGLLLCALCRMDASHILSRAVAMRDACDSSISSEANPALALAAFLAAGALEGSARLLLLTPGSLVPFAESIGQAVAASTGKNGHGIVPIFGDVPEGLEVFHRGCLAALITIAGDESPAPREAAELLAKAGVPLARIELRGPEDLGAELFKWELATALACAAIGVNPFVEPDIQEAREKTVEILEAIATKNIIPIYTVRVREGGIELYAERTTRQEISTLNLGQALRTFFELRNPDGSLIILSFLDRSADTEEALFRVRELLASRMGVPVGVSYGPRYLNYLGQLYKGGPAKYLFLLLTARENRDVAVPGAGYAFGQLTQALALGDFDALNRRGRPVLRLHFTEGVEQGFKQLEGVVQRSLANLSHFRR